MTPPLVVGQPASWHDLLRIHAHLSQARRRDAPSPNPHALSLRRLPAKPRLDVSPPCDTTGFWTQHP
eukprot:3244205-Prymnesium_polylepis.2